MGPKDSNTSLQTGPGDVAGDKKSKLAPAQELISEVEITSMADMKAFAQKAQEGNYEGETPSVSDF